MSLYRKYPQNTRNFSVYSVLFPESNSGSFSELVPRTLRILSHDILGRFVEDPIPSICKCQNWYSSVCSAQ